MKQEGATLVETLVVLAILAILSSLAGPNLQTIRSHAYLNSVTEELAADLRFARQLATTHRHRVLVAFDVEQQTIETQFVRGGTVHHRYHYANKGVVIDKPNVESGIVFHSSGRSATATTIRLHNSDGETRQITVGITGRVRVQ